MKQEFIDEMKAALESELADVKKELDAVSSEDKGDHVPGDRAPKFPNYGDDKLDENTESPQEVAQYMENVNATGVLESKHKEIVAALERIESGTYGTCDKKGKDCDITEERLRANPAAEKCIGCARSHTA